MHVSLVCFGILTALSSIQGYNDFVTTGSSAFPKEFGLNQKITFYWTNHSGKIYTLAVAKSTDDPGDTTAPGFTVYFSTSPGFQVLDKYTLTDYLDLF